MASKRKMGDGGITPSSSTAAIARTSEKKEKEEKKKEDEEEEEEQSEEGKREDEDGKREEAEPKIKWFRPPDAVIDTRKLATASNPHPTPLQIHDYMDAIAEGLCTFIVELKREPVDGTQQASAAAASSSSSSSSSSSASSAAPSLQIAAAVHSKATIGCDICGHTMGHEHPIYTPARIPDRFIRVINIEVVGRYRRDSPDASFSSPLVLCAFCALILRQKITRTRWFLQWTSQHTDHVVALELLDHYRLSDVGVSAREHARFNETVDTSSRRFILPTTGAMTNQCVLVAHVRDEAAKRLYKERRSTRVAKPPFTHSFTIDEVTRIALADTPERKLSARGKEEAERLALRAAGFLAKSRVCILCGRHLDGVVRMTTAYALNSRRFLADSTRYGFDIKISLAPERVTMKAFKETGDDLRAIRRQGYDGVYEEFVGAVRKAPAAVSALQYEPICIDTSDIEMGRWKGEGACASCDRALSQSLADMRHRTALLRKRWQRMKMILTCLRETMKAEAGAGAGAGAASLRNTIPALVRCVTTLM